MELSNIEVSTDAVKKSDNPDASIQGISGKSEDLQADLDKVAAEMGVPSFNISGKATPPSQPPTPEADVTAPSQPEKAEGQPNMAVDKFKTPDGQVDPAKIEKSITNVEAAIAKYQEKQRELGKLMNQVRGQERTLTQAPQQPQQTAPASPAMMPTLDQITPQMIEDEIKMNGQQVAFLKLAHIAQQSAYERARAEFQDIVSEVREKVSDTTTSKAIEVIGKHDPWVLSDEGISALSKILQDNPHLQKAKSPWTAAYKEFVAERELNKLYGSQVAAPTPKVVTASAPAMPVTAVNRPVIAPQVNLTSKQDINAYLNRLPLDKQIEVLEKLTGRKK